MDITPLVSDYGELFGLVPDETEDVAPVSVEDGLFRSLNDRGEVDIGYIASISNTPEAQVIRQLGDAIYQNPAKWEEHPFRGWETAEEYLSGVLVDKMNEAKRAKEKFGDCFQRNIDAISAVLPRIGEVMEMVILPGHPAVRPEDVQKFLLEVAGRDRDPYYVARDDLVSYDPLSASWKIRTRAFWSINSYSTFHYSFAELFEKLLNGSEITVEKTRNGKRVFDPAETLEANEKAGQLVRKFSEWIWKDPERKAYYTNWQYEHFGCVRKRQFNGGYLTFPGMNPEITLRPYQKDAVARILFSDNTLLAHDVGAGKTYVMIAAGMELRRLGKSRKNLYAVPNALTSQWTELFRLLYPQAKVLTVEPKTFLPKVRRQVLQQIRDEDFDAVIMASSCFDQIELSFDYYKKQLYAELEEIERARACPHANLTALDRKERSVKEKIKKAMGADTGKSPVYFDELGVTTLFLDEAHLYKNLPIKCSANIAGINKLGSRKCASMLEKVHCVQRKTGGRGAVFATATPVTNSISDIYVMQQYLQNGTLKLLNLSAFDAWIAMFAQKTSSYEVDVTGGLKTVSRFTSIQNLHDLSMLLSDVVDHHTEGGDGTPERVYHDITVPKSRTLQEVLDSLADRADAFHRGEVSAEEDNLLKITVDARKAALDVRLLAALPCAPVEDCKVSRCAAQVARIYRETAASKGTQIVFCDTSVPKKSFNIYDEMRRLLEAEGIPSREIAYIHDADTDALRSRLFDAMNRGDVRILIGSTAKAGLGLNVQTRLKALHHLDIPWRPADVTQREGRICRQGNRNDTVDIYRYITAGTFDAFSYQLLENKQKIISQLLSGIAAGTCDEGIDDPVLTYAQVKALCVGDDTVRELLEAFNEQRRFTMLRQQSLRRIEKLRYEHDIVLAEQAKQTLQRALNCKADAAFVRSELDASFSEGEKQIAPEAWRRLADHIFALKIFTPQTPEKTLPAHVPDKHERKRLRNRIIEAVRKNAYRDEEREIADYMGFSLILPAKMDPHKPFLIAARTDRYTVDLNAASGTGCLTRIDNVLRRLPREVEKCVAQLDEIDARRKQTKKAMGQVNDYREEIGFYSELIDELKKKIEGDQ